MNKFIPGKLYKLRISVWFYETPEYDFLRNKLRALPKGEIILLCYCKQTFEDSFEFCFLSGNKKYFRRLYEWSAKSSFKEIKQNEK
jgi:hypothetical protein